VGEHVGARKQPQPVDPALEPVVCDVGGERADRDRAGAAATDRGAVCHRIHDRRPERGAGERLGEVAGVAAREEDETCACDPVDDRGVGGIGALVQRERLGRQAERAVVLDASAVPVLDDVLALHGRGRCE
jgi:hypothetical protein